MPSKALPSTLRLSMNLPAQASLTARATLHIGALAFVGRSLLEGFETQEMQGYQHSGCSVDAGMCVWRTLETEIARNEPPAIHESFKLDRSYVYDIGLEIVLDVDVVVDVNKTCAGRIRKGCARQSTRYEHIADAWG